MKKMILFGMLVMFLAATRPAAATTWIWVADMSLIKYQLYPNGLIYFRNLNDFSSYALGCCSSYWIDTTTQDGRNAWATMLAAMAQHTGLQLGIPDGLVAGLVIEVGVW